MYQNILPTNVPTDQPTNKWVDRMMDGSKDGPSHTDAWTYLKMDREIKEQR